MEDILAYRRYGLVASRINILNTNKSEVDRNHIQADHAIYGFDRAFAHLTYRGLAGF